MSTQQENTPIHCENCNRETKHFVKYIGANNDIHYVCWRCVERSEKRINLKETWKRRHG